MAAGSPPGRGSVLARALPARSIPSLLSARTRQFEAVKALVRLIVLVLLSGPAALPTKAAFSSLYALGDGACSTTDNPQGGALYYPSTYSNGRIWIQVLAQRQGLTYDASKNLSYFYHLSSSLASDISQLSAPDAATALFVIWVSDADFVDDMTSFYPSQLDTTTWNNAINASLANHSQAIANLYAKGARTLIMPNAVDISNIPQYSGCTASQKSFIRGRVIYFNTGFATMLNQKMASLPGLKIYAPDIFTLFDNMLANPASYGLVNPGYSALDDGSLDPWHLNGPGAFYVFWDPWDPTAKAHEVMADTVQALISPVNISKLTPQNGSNRLDLVNIPVGLSGYADGRTNFVLGNWTQMTNFSSTSVTQTIYVPASGPQRSYRLRFPFAWSWP
jgi:hypothetical protein